MKSINRFFLAGLILFSSCSVLAEPTHIGVAVNRMVALELASDIDSICTNSRSFFRLFPNGQKSSTVFQVPANDYLVVTDVIWKAVPSPTSFTPGRVVTMRLDVRKPDGTYNGSPFRSAPQLITSEHGTMIGGSENLVSGVRFGSGSYLCAYAISESESSGAVNTVRTAHVYGYLVSRN